MGKIPKKENFLKFLKIDFENPTTMTPELLLNAKICIYLISHREDKI